ncbi:MAG: ABC transporter permease, partial [Dehalococcoidia bacterium]
MWIRSYRDWVPEPPVDIGEDLASIRGLGYFSVLGRLAADIPLDRARSEMEMISRQLAVADEEERFGYSVGLIPLQESIVGEVRPALLVLLGAVGLVLLIACANVANLLMARSSTRSQELAVRASLGASRPRLFRQLVVESLLLGGVAGGLGLGLARWGFGGLLLRLPTDIPRMEGITLDSSVLLFTLGASMVTGLIFGLMPALVASKTDLGSALKEGGRGLVGGGAARRRREILVAAEVALSVVLLSGAGLLMKSLIRLQDEEVGFEPENVLVMRMSLPEARYPDEEARETFVREMLAGVEAVPGVSSAGVVLVAPFSGGAATMSYDVEGMVPGEGEDFSSEYQVVTPDYFRTMGIPFLAGRTPEAVDDEVEGGADVIVVNEAFAQRHWGEENPLGQRVTFGGDGFKEIIGVVGNVRHFGFDRAPRPEAYYSYYSDPWPFLSLVVKTEVEPWSLAEPVRRQILALDPDQPVYAVSQLEEKLSESTGQRRFTMELLGIFAALAILLAVVGVYGVMAYSVSLRIHEMGIRAALGAARGEILRLTLGSGLRMATIGLAAGVVGSLGLTRFMSSLLYGVSPTDPMVLSLSALLLTGIVMMAAYFPAERATRVDPASVLRHE